MNGDLAKKALDVIESGDGNAALDLLKQIISSAAGVPPEPDENANAVTADDPSAEGDSDGGEGDGAEGVPSPAKTKPPKTEGPKIDAAAVRAGARALGWETPKPCK